jgi:hypothetical protein
LVSKARLVITAVLVEGRSHSQVARDYDVSPGWISRLIKRYAVEGEAAFAPRSRRPHTSPATTAGHHRPHRRTAPHLGRQGPRRRPHTIAWHLDHHHHLTVSPASVSNDRRPHRSLPHHATPAAIYTSRPKADPTTPIDTHHRVRTHRVHQARAVTLRANGRLHHYRTRVLILVQDHHITVINAATGAVLRNSTLDPTRD